MAAEILNFNQTPKYLESGELDHNSVLHITGTLGTIANYIKGRNGEIVRVEQDSCGCCSTSTLIAKVENGVICLEPIGSWDPTPLEELSQSF